MRKFLTSRNAVMLFVAVVAGFIPGILQIQIETDVSSALLLEGGKYLEYRKEFPSDYGSKVLIAVPMNVTKDWWQAFDDLHYALMDLDQTYRIESMINARHTIKYFFDDGETGLEMGDFITPDTELNHVLWDKAVTYGRY